MKRYTGLFSVVSCFFLIINSATIYSLDNKAMQELVTHFQTPPTDCWPHTRWWWMGNAVTTEEITWQLQQMREHGVTGVEQITMGEVYEKGNIPYLSDKFLDMLKHTVKEAKRLGMEVSINFGGPGWVIGGAWVPQEDRAKDMVPTFIDVVGPYVYSGPLPKKLTQTQRSWEHYKPYLDGSEQLLAVVAGKVIDGKIDQRSITVLTEKVRDNNLEWQVPVGHWRLMAFWLKYSEQGFAVDHFNKTAMQRYCDYLGSKFYQAFGAEFGKTVDSFFCDSFEIGNTSSGIYWTTGLFEEFEKFKGYDLIPYLPAIWWEVDDITPKIRYDVNHFLHQVGLEAFFKTFLNWCEQHGVKGRIQPYGFSTDNIAGAGLTHIPEMEITAGEKDAADWFDIRIGPKKYVASGAHIYGRDVVSAEAYTFMHWERYRSTLEELKIASDNYLRYGATKFYNHGYCFSPERDVAPTRTIGFAAVINHQNIWWKYYPMLAEYIARCCYMLRQGEFAPDIAVYSPLANQWTKNVLNARKWTREFDWGELGKLLIANGYDFDLLNDDALQNFARSEDGKIKIRNLAYKLLLLPNIEALPLETMEFIERYAREGGVVIALERVPAYSTGLTEYEMRDKKVQSIVAAMFDEPVGRDGTAPKQYGLGHTYHIKNVIDRKIWWDKRSSALDPFLNTIRRHLAPDFAIDFAHEGLRENQGLTFMHRKTADFDIYFVANIQDRASTIPVTFRVNNKSIWKCNPYTGKITQIFNYLTTDTGMRVPLSLAAYESCIIVFVPQAEQVHVEQTNFHDIISASTTQVEAVANENGSYYLTLISADDMITKKAQITAVPAPFIVSGEWRLTLEEKDFPKQEKTLIQLCSWVDDPATKHFSGTGCYEIFFDLPANYKTNDLQLQLDLGKVGNIAEVELNGVNVGTVWMRGQVLDITQQSRAGQNKMTVWVTNTLINKVSAFKEPNPVPQHLVNHFGSKRSLTDRTAPEFGFEPLPASGLIGPVKIYAFKKVHVQLD